MTMFLEISLGVFTGYLAAFLVLYIVSTIVSNIMAKKRNNQIEELIQTLERSQDLAEESIFSSKPKGPKYTVN